MKPHRLLVFKGSHSVGEQRHLLALVRQLLGPMLLSWKTSLPKLVAWQASYTFGAIREPEPVSAYPSVRLSTTGSMIPGRHKDVDGFKPRAWKPYVPHYPPNICM